MNTYGFIVKSSIFSQTCTYLVFAENTEKAKELIEKEKDELLALKNGWTWGVPTINEVSNLKELQCANLIWDEGKENTKDTEAEVELF